MQAHRRDWDKLIQQKMKQGMSYPQAAAQAFTEVKAPKPQLSLREPNNILGYHYIKAIDDLNANIQAFTIPRSEAKYHDQELPEATIASATSIRNALSNHSSLNAINRFIPEFTEELLASYERDNRLWHSWEDYFHLLRYRLLSSSAEQLAQIYECEEGLEFRLKETIKSQRRLSNGWSD